MTAPTRDQLIAGWALECGLIDERDVDNGIVDALFDDLWRFAEIDLRRFAELAYAAGQTAEREACAKVLDQMAEEAEQDCEPSSLVAYYREKAAAIRARGTA